MMRRIPERKRMKITGKGGKSLWVGIEHWIVDTPQFKALQGSDVKFLVHLGREYNGHNNGDLSIANIRKHWRSRDTVQNAIKRLIEGGWIIKTRLGGLHMGPDLYAMTWWPIDACKTHDYSAETRASNLWLKKMTDRNPELVVPESGTVGAPNWSRNDHSVPETGTTNARFKAA